MEDEQRTIRCHAEWEEAVIKGSFSCPDCDGVMLVFETVDNGYAYCLKCKKYWIDKRRELPANIKGGKE